MSKSTLTIRAKQKGEITDVRVTISHPMTTGDCKEQTDENNEALYIQEFKCTHNGRTVITGMTGPSLAEDPYFAFRFKGGKQGDTINLSWVDNKGNKDDLEAKIF